MTRSKWLPALWSLGLLVVCWMPRSGLPLNESTPTFLKVVGFDKLIHAGIFAGYAFLWRRVSPPQWAIPIALAGLALAIVTELGQNTWIVARDADVLDGVADFVGVVLGLILYEVVNQPDDPLDEERTDDLTDAELLERASTNGPSSS